MKRQRTSSLRSTSRRSFLGGLCSTAAAVPFLRSFSVGAEEGAGPLPKVLFIGFPNGPLVGPGGGGDVDGWRPDGTPMGGGALPMEAADFPEIFRPLAPFRERLVFLENIQYIDQSNPHRQTSAMLTGRTRDESNGLLDYTSTGISVDHFLANQFAGNSELATNVLNTAFRIQGYAPGESYWSYTGPGERVEPIQNPVQTYQRVFGEGSDDAETTRRLMQRQSVLDAIAKDVGQMMQRAPAADRPRLEQHLDGIRGLEQSLSASVCDGGTIPGEYEFLTHGSAPRVMRDHADAIVQAMACGFSRIATMQLGSFGGEIRPLWPELGISHGAHSTHAICHAFAGIEGAGSQGLTSEMGKTLGVAQEVAYSRIMADVLERLETTPDIDGSPLLDNTLVIYARPMGRNHRSDKILWLAAGGSGVGVNGGRWLELPEGAHHYNDVLTAVCDRMGHPVDTFGEAQFCNEPVPLG